MSRLTEKALACFTAVLIAVLALATAQADETDAELEQVRKRVGEMFDMLEPQDVKSSPVEGWYTIHRGSIVAYISADGRYLLQGDLVDLDHQVNLTENLRNETRAELMAKVTDEETILFSPEAVKYSISVFTDVDCTYCRRLHSQIEEYMAHGIEVRYFMYPRNGPASRAWSTMEEVWCASDRQTALTMAKLDRDFPTNKCDASMVQEHYVIGRDVGLTGTPAIVLEDGTLISGYLAPDQLIATLQSKGAAE
jgi:thiol:disulfide interchange protein DsbC